MIDTNRLGIYASKVGSDSRLDYKLKGLLICLASEGLEKSFTVDEVANLWSLTSTRARHYLDILLRNKYIEVVLKEGKLFKYSLKEF